jgi:TolA-binding protein
MRFLMCAAAAVLIMTYGLSYAGDDPGTLDKWLQDMKGMIEKIVPQKATPQGTTAVSGVRSDDKTSEDVIYWRGKKENISEEELADFRSALVLAEQGKKEEAVRKFEDFLEHYPGSPLSKDAKITVEKLKSSS